MRTSLRGAALLAAATLAASGCGGGGGGGGGGKASPTGTPTAATGGSGGTLSLAADKTKLKFDRTTLSARAGKVTIVMSNPSSIPHDVAIEGNGVTRVGKVVGKGGTSKVTADLKPGKYTFYCSVDAHRQAGMEGTLTVK